MSRWQRFWRWLSHIDGDPDRAFAVTMFPDEAAEKEDRD